jgi:phosphonate transport system ATP-binding protein
MLRFEEVSKRFADGTVALDRVSFEVPRGQLCAVLGPSGAGKSTLLRLVNGMLMPSSGRVEVGDTPVTARSVARIRRRIGMVHQQFHLVPRLGVLDNVLAGALPAMSTWRTLLRLWPRPLVERALALLDQVELTERHLYQRASLLSGGEQQRVAIARAFILAPDVVLADEPVASLDPVTSRSVVRIVAIRRGALVFDGAPGALDAAAAARIYADAAPRDRPELAAGPGAGAKTGSDAGPAAMADDGPGTTGQGRGNAAHGV